MHTPCAAAFHGSSTPSAQAAAALIIAQETPQNTPKIPRIRPERTMFSRLGRRTFLLGMSLVTRRRRGLRQG
jgi:hypothetical protein